MVKNSFKKVQQSLFTWITQTDSKTRQWNSQNLLATAKSLCFFKFLLGEKILIQFGEDEQALKDCDALDEFQLPE